MNLSTLCIMNLDWTLEDKIKVIVREEEKGDMTFLQAIKQYNEYRVVAFNNTRVWLSTRMEE